MLIGCFMQQGMCVDWLFHAVRLVGRLTNKLWMDGVDWMTKGLGTRMRYIYGSTMHNVQ